MTDYKKLWQQLWEQALSNTAQLETNSADFLAEFIKQTQANGSVLDADGLKTIDKYVANIKTILASGIHSRLVEVLIPWSGEHHMIVVTEAGGST
jgi:hypothetical protein